MTRDDPGTIEVSFEQLQIELDMKNVKCLSLLGEFTGVNDNDSSDKLCNWKNADNSKWLRFSGITFEYITTDNFKDFMNRRIQHYCSCPPLVLIDRNSDFFKFKMQINWYADFWNWTFIDAKFRKQQLQYEIDMLNEFV